MSSTPKKPTWPHGHITKMYAHRNGKWAKKISGKTYYFAEWHDPNEALAEYFRNYANGAMPVTSMAREMNESKTTLLELCDRFYESKANKVACGELSQRTLADYRLAANFLLQHESPGKLIDSFGPDTFMRLNTALAQRYGITKRGNMIIYIRSIFRYAEKNDLTEKRVKFGDNFSKPRKSLYRKHRAEQGVQIFKPEEIRELMNCQQPILRACICLGINGALGNTECAMLKLKEIDLANRTIKRLRHKTSADMLIWLWPETIEAIERVLDERPKPAGPQFRDYLLLSPNGRGILDANGHDSFVAKKFNAICEFKGFKHRFYSLRRTFKTVACRAASTGASKRRSGAARS